MGAQPDRQSARANAPRALPASVDDGDLAGVPVEDIARAHGLTLEAAGRFRAAWNEAASHHTRSAQRRRGMLDLEDIDADPRNWEGR